MLHNKEPLSINSTSVTQEHQHLYWAEKEMLLAHLYLEVECVVCGEAPLWAVPLRESPQAFFYENAL